MRLLHSVLANFSLEELRKSWRGAIGREEFLVLLHRCTPLPHESEWATAATDLFGEIDFRGDGLLRWSDFASYVMNTISLQASRDSSVPRSKCYELKHSEEMLSCGLVKLDYLPSPVGKLMAIPRGVGRRSELVHFISCDDDDAPPRISATLRHHSAYLAHGVLNAAGVPRTNLVVTASSVETVSQHFLSLWSLPFAKKASIISSENTNALKLPVLLNRVETPSPQSALLVSSSDDRYRLYSSGEASGMLYEWELVKNDAGDFVHLRVLRSCRLHTFGITAILEFHHKHIEGTDCIVTGSSDGSISIWNPESDWKQKELATPTTQLSAHPSGPGTLLISQVHGLLCAAGRQPHHHDTDAMCTTVLVWNVALLDFSTPHLAASKQVHNSLTLHRAHVADMTEVVAESHLVTADVSGVVAIWSLPSLDLAQQLSLYQPCCCSQVPTSSSSHSLLVVSTDTRMRVYPCQLTAIREPLVMAHYDCHVGNVVVISPQRVCVWNAKTGRLKSHVDAATLLAEDFDGRAWATLETSSPEIVCASVSANGRKLVLGDDHANIHVCIVPPGENCPFRVKRLDPHSAMPTSVSFLDSCGAVLSTGSDGVIGIHDEADPEGYRTDQNGVVKRSVRVRDVKVFTTALDGSCGVQPPSPLPNKIQSDLSERASASSADSSSDSISSASSSTEEDDTQNKTLGRREVITMKRSTHEILLATADLHLNLIASLNSSSSSSFGTAQACVWDFELLTLVGTCVVPMGKGIAAAAAAAAAACGDDEQRVESISGLAFMSPRPILAGSTSHGSVHLWKVPECTILQTLDVLDSPRSRTFVTTGTLQATTPERRQQITVLETSSSSSYNGGAVVAGGTDDGYVVLWILKNLFLQKCCSAVPPVRKLTYNPLRQVHSQINWSEHKRSRRNSHLHLRKSSDDHISFRSWCAHDDGEVSHLQIICRQNVILTSSDDGIAHLWQWESGTLLGSLDVNFPLGLNWNFQPASNVDSREQFERDVGIVLAGAKKMLAVRDGAVEGIATEEEAEANWNATQLTKNKEHAFYRTIHETRTRDWDAVFKGLMDLEMKEAQLTRSASEMRLRRKLCLSTSREKSQKILSQSRSQHVLAMPRRSVNQRTSLLDEAKKRRTSLEEISERRKSSLRVPHRASDNTSSCPRRRRSFSATPIPDDHKRPLARITQLTHMGLL